MEKKGSLQLLPVVQEHPVLKLKEDVRDVSSMQWSKVAPGEFINFTRYSNGVTGTG